MTPDPLKGFLSLSGSSAYSLEPLPLTYTPIDVIAGGVSDSEQYTLAVRHIEEIAGLQTNWDGYGGVSVSRQAIDCARSLLWAQVRCSSGKLPIPDVTPTANGTLVVEWQGKDGEAAIEIGMTRVSGVIRSGSTPRMYLASDSKSVPFFLPSLIAPLLNSDALKTETITRVDYDLSANA